MKMKTNVSVLLVAALTLLITTFSFMEVSATCRQRQMITDKSSNVHSSVEAGGLALCQSLPSGQPNNHVPLPPPEQKSRKISFEKGASRKSPGPQCNRHVPTCPPSGQAKKEQQVKASGKAELLTNYQTSINDGKHASADYSY